MAGKKIPLIIRFSSKVNKSPGQGPKGDCWEWTAGTDEQGYGMMHIREKGQSSRAPRISWAIHYGPVPNGLMVLHRCDNPPCVRPDHLFLGTNQDNTADRVKKNRTRRAFGKGSKHPNAILDEAMVLKIRAMLKDGKSQIEIAREVHIDPSTVSRIYCGKCWTHV